MLRAMIFDFDGVLVDSEPLIMKLTQAMAAKEGWTLTEEDYYRNYLALDDRGIIEHLYRSHGRRVGPARRDELLQWKSRVYQEAIRNGLPPLPGAIEFVRRMATQFPLAIASGSLRDEVEYLLRKLGLREKFAVLVTAEDCKRSKPDPEVFLKALAGLQQLPALRPEPAPAADPASRPCAPLRATECLAIEDAPAGVEAAHAAGMRCLALAHSCPPEELVQADWVCRKFADVDFEKIRAALGET